MLFPFRKTAAVGYNPDRSVVLEVFKTKNDFTTVRYVTTIRLRDYKC